MHTGLLGIPKGLLEPLFPGDDVILPEPLANIIVVAVVSPSQGMLRRPVLRVVAPRPVAQGLP